MSGIPVFSAASGSDEPRLPLISYRNDNHVEFHLDLDAGVHEATAIVILWIGASDRERLYALYFRRFVDRGGMLRDILDIAPAHPLAAFLERVGTTGYRTADLTMDNVTDRRIDIQDMHDYEDDRFQFFVCSHVLEHVPNDVAAIGELYRILAPGGWGICMVPINLGLSEIYENPDIADEAGRWKHFGQNDHVRVYSKAGFVERLESAGFRVAQHGIAYFGEEVFKRHAIHPRSVLYIAHKDAKAAAMS